MPINTYIKIPDVMSAPREEGDNIPSIAKTKRNYINKRHVF